MKHIDQPALTVWQQNPTLAHAFGDFRSFAENYYAISQAGVRDSLAWCSALSRAYEGQFSEANIRLEAVRHPATASALRAPHWSRAGAVLTLWHYGPIHYSAIDGSGLNIAAACAVALKENPDAGVVVVRIASPGGVFLPAKDLAFALSQHRGTTIAIIDYSCWSAAVVVASACDRVFIRASATMMMHNTVTSAVGRADDLELVAARLRDQDDLYVRTVARARNLSASRLARLLPAERFLTAGEAVQFGLADDVLADLPLSLPANTEQGDVSIDTHRS